MNVADQIHLDAVAGQQRQRDQILVQHVTGEQVERAAKERERAFGHPRDLILQQFSVAAREGSVVGMKLLNRVTHDKCHLPGRN